MVTGLACCHSGKDPAGGGGLLRHRDWLLSPRNFEVVLEFYEHVGLRISPLIMLVSIPIVVGAVALLIVRVKQRSAK